MPPPGYRVKQTPERLDCGLTAGRRTSSTQGMIRRVPTFCGKDCGGNACPLLAVLNGGRVERLERNPAGAELKPCPRGYALHREHYAAERLLSPLIADGPRGCGRYREASWDEALSLVADRLGELRGRHGPTGLMALGSSGSTGLVHDSQNLLKRFVNACGGGVHPRSNYSNGAAGFALPYLFGAAAGESGWDAKTVRQSRLIVLWGANILEARLGAELGPEVAAAARSGVPVVYIDPRRTMTAKALGASWIPIRPGTDAAMMLATLRVLFRDGLVDRDRARRLAVGLDELERYVSGDDDGVERSPAWAERICGVPAGVIEGFARSYAAARPAMLVPGYSIQRVARGEETFRLSVALQVATGNLGVPGGSSGSLNNRLPGVCTGAMPDLADRLVGDARTLTVPVLRWPDAILSGRSGGIQGDVKAAYVAGFNALGQGADNRKSARALESLEFSVCHEMFMTPTARRCDVVLPILSPLEKEDACAPWHGNYLLYKPAALPPRGLARSDYDIFAELSERLGAGEAFSEGLSATGWLDRLLAESEIRDLEAFKATGVYFGADRERVGLARFASDPEGHPLPTPSGRIELRSDAYASDTGEAAIPTWKDSEPDPSLPFLLVTPKTIRRTHSQLAYGPGPDLGELSVSFEDAARLSLASGDRVEVGNASGRLLATAAVTDDIAPGVVCLHEGAWFDPGPDGVDRGGSANELSSTDGTGPASAPVMHGIPCALRKIRPTVP